MQIYIFANAITEMEIKQRLASSTECYNERYALQILDIFKRYVRKSRANV